jgi:hypothetical protein
LIKQKNSFAATRNAAGALRRLRLAEELTEREWRMVFYSLADNDPLYPDRPILLEDDIFFPEVDNAIKTRLESKALKRKDWTALCSSYFAYQHESPEKIHTGAYYVDILPKVTSW